MVKQKRGQRARLQVWQEIVRARSRKTIPLPVLDYDPTDEWVSLELAAMIYVRGGQCGPLVEEYDAQTIDPLFTLFADERVAVQGVNPKGVMEPIAGVWSTASVSDYSKPRWNSVDVHEGTLTRCDEDIPHWIDIRVKLPDLLGTLSVPTVSSPKPAIVTRPPLWVAIDETIAKEWPEGMPAFTSKRERNRVISDLLGRPVPPSEDTYRRYFRERETGRDPQ